MPNEDQQPDPVEAPIVEVTPDPDPAELQVEAADTLSDPVVVEAPLDPQQPVRWLEQEGPPRERRLPAAGQIHIQWQMVILGSQGVIYEGDYDHVHRQIDSPAHVHNVGESIQKIIEGTLVDPLKDDLALYTATRCGQQAPKAAPVAQLPPTQPAQITDSAPPISPLPMPGLPPPPNPGAKI